MQQHLHYKGAFGFPVCMPGPTEQAMAMLVVHRLSRVSCPECLQAAAEGREFTEQPPTPTQ